MNKFNDENAEVEEIIGTFSKQQNPRTLLRKTHEHYTAVFENFPFVAFTLDRKGRFIESNEYTEKLFGIDPEKARGKGFYELGLLNKKEILKGLREFKKNLAGKVTSKTVYEIKIKEKKHFIELVGIPLLENGIVTEVLDVGTDVTQHTNILKEKEKLIKELKKTVENIEILKGLLPICAGCKKIRDDDGYWHQVEDFLKEHSDIEFSHSLCPDCLKKLYPDYQKGKK
ncbi:PAS domain-containing protein [candidate division WOR-3 bacterium]|nr:PAS domain-containing protein [candidate division WOR-3 bacterium]